MFKNFNFFGYRLRYFLTVDKIYLKKNLFFRILNLIFKFNIFEKRFFQLLNSSHISIVSNLKAFFDEFKK
jgi:hypothetical protein